MKRLVQIIIIISVLLSGCVTQRPAKTDSEPTPAATAELVTVTTTENTTSTPETTTSDTAVLDYVGEVLEVSSDIISATRTANQLAGMIGKVWSNAIYEKSDVTTNRYTKNSNGQFYKDFNDAILAYTSSIEYLEDVAEIKSAGREFESVHRLQSETPVITRLRVFLFVRYLFGLNDLGSILGSIFRQHFNG